MREPETRIIAEAFVLLIALAALEEVISPVTLIVAAEVVVIARALTPAPAVTVQFVAESTPAPRFIPTLVDVPPVIELDEMLMVALAPFVIAAEEPPVFPEMVLPAEMLIIPPPFRYIPAFWSVVPPNTLLPEMLMFPDALFHTPYEP
jgi:hypothetical protein